MVGCCLSDCGSFIMYFMAPKQLSPNGHHNQMRLNPSFRGKRKPKTGRLKPNPVLTSGFKRLRLPDQYSLSVHYCNWLIKLYI